MKRNKKASAEPGAAQRRRADFLRRIALVGCFLLGLFLWYAVPAYCYFALPVWGLGGLYLVFRLLRQLAKRKPKLARRLKMTLIILLVLALIFLGTVECLILQGAQGAPEPEADYLLVLGAAVKGEVPSRSLAERLTAALSYLEAHPDTVCIVSGGKGWGENITEAQCMSQWLLSRGIDPERVWPEDRATSTWENLGFTLDLIEERTGTRPDRLAVVSSEYHLYRAGLMARSLGLDFLGVPAKTHPWLNRIHYYFREFFGVVHFWVLGR